MNPMMMMNIYKCVLKTLKFCAKYDYNDYKQMGELSRHMQYKVITFCDGYTKVCDNNHDQHWLNGRWWTINNLVGRWSWNNWNYIVFTFKGLEILKFIVITWMVLKSL